MQAIILAGGLGTRLRQAISDRPKPMALINNRPFLEYLILQLRNSDIKDIILSVGYKKEDIINYFASGSGLGVDITYSKEKDLLGTGGAVLQAMEYIDDENFLVMNGDSFLDIDIRSMIRMHESRKAYATIGLAEVDDAQRYGAINLDGQKITSFREKNKAAKGYINGGVYIFNKRIKEFFPQGKSSLEKDVLPKLTDQVFLGYAGSGFFIDIGTEEDYVRMQKEFSLLKKSVKLN